MISHSVACATFTRSTTTGDPRQNSSPSRNPGLDLLRFAAAAALAILYIRTNVSRVDRGCAAADLWALSQARVILGSGGSTFTGWGSFLGGAPLALVPGQSLEWLGFHNHRDAWRGNVDPANAPEFAAFCEAVKRAVDAASL